MFYAQFSSTFIHSKYPTFILPILILLTSWKLNFFAEIPNFLSEDESRRLLHFAEHGNIETSDVYHHSMDELLSQTSFEQWDLNRDDVIDSDEV